MAKRIPRTHPDYRPRSYWKGEPDAAVVAGIRDVVEREEILAKWQAGNLTDDDGDQLGAVTVVRIELQSVHNDVIDLLAIPQPDGKIRLVWRDDYESEFEQPLEIINQPMSQAEMISFIQGTNQGNKFVLPLCYNKFNLENDAEMTAEELRSFTRLESRFYPGLRIWFGQILEEWINTLDF
jgi:hypothetical protein